MKLIEPTDLVDGASERGPGLSLLFWHREHIGMQEMQKGVMTWMVANVDSIPQFVGLGILDAMEAIIKHSLDEKPKRSVEGT